MEHQKKFMISISQSVIFALLAPASLYAACPPNYQSTEELRVSFYSARWAEEGAELALCTNLSHPKLNQRSDSYGYDYGPANYRCGDIYMDNVYLGNVQRMFLQPSDRSLRPVEFTQNSKWNWNQDVQKRSWCEASGVDSQTCYSERKMLYRWFQKIYQYRQESDALYESLSRKEKRLMDREGAGAVLRNLETEYKIQNISTCKKTSF